MMKMTLCVLLSSIFSMGVIAKPHPIQFSIPGSKVVTAIPEKTRDFAIAVPSDPQTYIYDKEEDYYKGYQCSYFAVTRKKAGWDCMRHYEILANGCIPYFVDMDKCDEDTMPFLPKDLIREAMNLKGVSYLHIDHEVFDKEKYYTILNQLLEHTRKYLTTEQMAKYVLKTISYQGTGKILYLSLDPFPDYLRCLMLIGFKDLYGAQVVDYPKLAHVYTTCPYDKNLLYGKGISYSGFLPDLAVDRSNILQRIQAKEFDLIVYGSIHRGVPFYEIVKNLYEPSKIVYLCGEDEHQCQYVNLPNFFLRESAFLHQGKQHVQQVINSEVK